MDDITQGGPYSESFDLMYRIEKEDFGFRLIFRGVATGDEMARWCTDFSARLPVEVEDFCVFVDMRSLAPLDKAGQEQVAIGQKLAKKQGMVRSVVILSNPVTTLQFKHIAMDTGIYEWERYIDASKEPDWEQVGLDWIVKAIDPDKSEETPAFSVANRQQ